MSHLSRSTLTFIALLAGCQSMGSGGSAPSSSNTASVGAETAAAGTDARAAVTELFEEFRKALQEKNTAVLDRIWSDDLTFVNFRGQLLTKAQRMQNIRSGATSFKSIQVNEQVVRPYGDVAVLNGVVTLEAQYSGEEGSGTFRFTSVCSRKGGRWQIVAQQMTKIEK